MAAAVVRLPSVLTLQAWYRGLALRARLQKDKKENSAAIQIQSAQRVRVARRTADLKRGFEKTVGVEQEIRVAECGISNMIRVPT